MSKIVEKYVTLLPQCELIVIQLLRLLNIPFAIIRVQKELTQHLNYPSLLSISDILKKYGVNSTFIHVNASYIREISAPFLVSIKGQEPSNNTFAIVYSRKENQITFFDFKKKGLVTLEFIEFEELYAGIALLLEYTKKKQIGKLIIKKENKSNQVKKSGLPPTIYHFTPYSNEKCLGKAYNQYCKLVPNDSDWICIRDGDTMFLNFDWGHIISDAIANYSSKYSVFTCYASRIGGIAQQYGNIISEDPNIINHRNIAIKNAKENQNCIKDISDIPYISGHFMLFPKWLWKKIGFIEQTSDGTLLGIDNYFFITARIIGARVGLIESLYVFHYYRLKEGHQHISHLV